MRTTRRLAVATAALCLGIAVLIARTSGPGARLAGNPPDTSANVHIGLGGITNIGNCCRVLEAGSPRVGEVWNWNQAGAKRYPEIYKGKYFPADRQPDTRYNAAAEPLSWFVARHPEWLEFTCGAVGLTERQAIAGGHLAYAFGAGSYIPLDTANPAVLRWEERRFWGPSAASGHFGHLDFDNFQMTNGGAWSGRRCGHYRRSGTWVQQYNGTNGDPAYRRSEIDLAAAIQSWLHGAYPNVAFAANLSWNTKFVGDEETFLSHVDLWFDELGFTGGGTGTAGAYRGSAWTAKARATAQFLGAGGHGWEDMNLEPSTAITPAQRQWALANYLLLKNDHSWLYICPVSDCYDSSAVLDLPEYRAAHVGTATDIYHADQGVYRRDFTNGLVLVNPSGTTSHTVTLPAGGFENLYGKAEGHALVLPAGSGIVLVR